MTTITDEDRAAAASGYFAWCSGNETIPNKILTGRADDHSMVQAFARHRQAAFNAGLERAAVIAEQEEGNANNAAYDRRQAGLDDTHQCAKASAAWHIADAIRAEKEKV